MACSKSSTLSNCAIVQKRIENATRGCNAVQLRSGIADLSREFAVLARELRKIGPILNLNRPACPPIWIAPSTSQAPPSANSSHPWLSLISCWSRSSRDGFGRSRLLCSLPLLRNSRSFPAILAACGSWICGWTRPSSYSPYQPCLRFLFAKSAASFFAGEIVQIVAWVAQYAFASSEDFAPTFCAFWMYLFGSLASSSTLLAETPGRRRTHFAHLPFCLYPWVSKAPCSACSRSYLPSSTRREHESSKQREHVPLLQMELESSMQTEHEY